MIEKNNIISINNKYIKYIEQNTISECLSKVNLVITDFSSIIFDLIYRKKPFIIYIPDINETEIESNYKKNYYELINNFKNGIFNFENIYFNINNTIDKIIYYINNDFNLDYNIKNLYDNLGLKSDNNINNFIDYLINLK